MRKRCSVDVLRRWMQLALFATLCGVITACASAPRAADERDAGETGIVDFSCNEDSDCEVKDVGNCCGHYPACVNQDSETFPERVAAQCAKEGMMGVCGFPVISGCSCVDNRCAAKPATLDPA